MRSLIALAVVLVVVVGGITALALFLGSLSSEGEESADQPDREPLTIVTAEGDVTYIDVEIAETRDERAAGLSNRDEVPDDTGMLFVFEGNGTGFWMVDTFVPLSIAFLADCGEIIEIQDMQPHDRTLHRPDEPFQYGLEAPQGWFAANNIEAGDLVSIPRDYRNEGC